MNCQFYCWWNFTVRFRYFRYFDHYNIIISILDYLIQVIVYKIKKLNIIVHKISHQSNNKSYNISKVIFWNINRDVFILLNDSRCLNFIGCIVYCFGLLGGLTYTTFKMYWNLFKNFKCLHKLHLLQYYL